MKKIIALLTVVAVMFAFSACSSKKYKDIEATVPVTDSQGVTVTDKNGEVVTELSTQKSETSSSTTAKEDKTTSGSKATTKKSENTTKSAKTTKGEKTTKKKEKTTKSKGKETTGDDNKTQGNADKVTTTDKTTDATTTTEKPKKRDITVYVVLPYYNNESAKVKIGYKLDGDKEYEQIMFEDPDDSKKEIDYKSVKLDGKATVKCTIKKVKGDVTVRANVTGFSGKDSIHNNKVTVKSNENEVTIKPLTGIGMVDADDEVIE